MPDKLGPRVPADPDRAARAAVQVQRLTAAVAPDGLVVPVADLRRRTVRRRLRARSAA